MPFDTYSVIMLAQNLFVSISALTLWIIYQNIKGFEVFLIFFSVVCKNYCYQEKIIVVNKQANIEEQRAAVYTRHLKIVTQV